MNSKTVIVGGGFAGRQACRALRGADTEIVLFDPRSSTVMLPALPDLAGGWLDEKLLYSPLANLLPKNVRHIQKSVSSIDLNAKTLTADGQTFAFDKLLIAAGSVTDFRGFNQHREQIYHLDSLETALHIRNDFVNYLRRTKQPHIVMAGGGYTGLELAMSLYYRALAENKPCRVTVIDPAPDILPFLPEAKRQYIKTFLARTGATILPGQHVTGFDGQNVTAGNQTFENGFFCWAGGSTFAIPELKGTVARLGDGRLKVNPDLSLPNYPDVFAAGDSAAVEQNGQILRKAINFAWYEGKCAGKNIARHYRGKTTKPFRPFDAGWVIPLHSDSVGQLFSRIWIKGKLGLRLHYFMCGFRNTCLANFAGFVRIAAKLFKEVSHD
ncbi:MAG: FAD-dependent oxidoreductase [Kiritimatiellaceae bacterium]|nr:FAD-dependent oxidoreductase [Kiritimatiellaceae bacterium]